MDFALSDEQKLLDDTVSRFVTNDYDFKSRTKIVASELGFSRENWKLFAELGWLAVPFSEADGGFGGGTAECAIVFENIGKGLVVEPYLATVVLAGRTVAIAGNDDQKARYLSKIIDGSLLGALLMQSRIHASMPLQ